MTGSNEKQKNYDVVKSNTFKRQLVVINLKKGKADFPASL